MRDDVRREFDVAKENIADAESRIKCLEGEKKELKNKLDYQIVSKQVLQSALDQRGDELSACRREVSVLMKEVDALEKECEDHVRHAVEQSDEIERLTGLLDVANNSLPHWHVGEKSGEEIKSLMTSTSNDGLLRWVDKTEEDGEKGKVTVC